MNEFFDKDDLLDAGFNADWFKDAYSPDAARAGNMQRNFLIPPFSVLDASQGYWQERKRTWLEQGINSHEGRADNLISYSNVSTTQEKDTSIFDPVLCEVLYTWFCPEGGTVIDPFSGGSVRGIVASKLGLDYIGVDLRSEQVDANIKQAAQICAANKPVYYTGDSANLDTIVQGQKADFFFSCPPYADLEVYSELPQDLSNMPYKDFIEVYAKIIKQGYDLLNNNRFACFIVGEVRAKKGEYLNFVGDTVKAFVDAGFKYYNEAILVTAVGSLPLRAGKVFKSSRKVGKRHQNVLVFLKGDGKLATKNLADTEVYIPDMAEIGQGLEENVEI